MLPRYAQLPATLLWPAGRRPEFEGQRSCRILLMNALPWSREAAGTIAAMAVLVGAEDAEDEGADIFNWRFHFLPPLQQPGHLFLPMKPVAALFG